MNPPLLLSGTFYGSEQSQFFWAGHLQVFQS